MASRCPENSVKTTIAVVFCLFGSGLSSLIYQTTWFREFRYIFGASTAATAAVLAVFMGGLGWGSIVLGKRADASSNPLRIYARLELFIAGFAALSPVLVLLVRSFYLGLGGSTALHPVVSVLVRLALCAVVLFVPAFLMGGTLPAVMKALSNRHNANRGHVAWSYGANALGAVAGVGLSTFYLLELLGNRGTLWSACFVNAVVAVSALALARTNRETNVADEVESAEPVPIASTTIAPKVLYTAAALTGFAFFLMELVWYRMLAPILGGSTFTFGVVLAVALAGIALGSLGAAAILRRWRATPNLFSWLCALEALCLAFPFALGDRIAFWTLIAQPLGQISFAGHIAQWLITTAIVVFPAALIAGAQFPILIALLGRGETALGTQTGCAYAWNTFGAVAGSLAGGFGLLPFLTAPGAWKLVVIAMFGLTLVFLWVTVRRDGWSTGRGFPGLIGAVALTFLMARGPSAVWRHNAVGVGRAKLEGISQNDYERMTRDCRHSIVWEAEGKESSVALTGDNGYAFFVNGKCDGNSVGDAGTQVMLGLLGALVHPGPHNACVIGLGTGSTAGWLGQVPGLDRVDVVELEPVIHRVAEACAPVNHNVVQNPKVHFIYNDAREVLLTTRSRYDLIVSEPSNPYRAGIAGLFTVEYYEAIDRCLAEGGIFVQWIQAYEIDGASVATICATLATVFPAVEIWESELGDLAFVAGRQARRYDLDQWRERIGQSPFREALSLIWYVNDVEGVFNRFIAGDALPRAALAGGAKVSTDDRNRLEFALARSVGRSTEFGIETLRRIARAHQWDRPRYIGEPPETLELLDRRSTEFAVGQMPISDYSSGIPSDVMARGQAKDAFTKGDLESVAELWNSQSQPPSDPFELQMLALALASQGDEKALPFIEQLRAWRPIDAGLIEVHYLWQSKRFREAVPRMAEMLSKARTSPWISRQLVADSLRLIKETSFPPNRREDLLKIYESVEKPFAVNVCEDVRLDTWLDLARKLDGQGYPEYTRAVIASLEPNFPWTEDLLDVRADCYTQLRHPLAGQANHDLRLFRERSAVPFDYLPPRGALKVSARERSRAKTN